MRFAECAVREAECCAVDKVEVYDTVPWRKVPLYSILSVSYTHLDVYKRQAVLM